MIAHMFSPPPRPSIMRRGISRAFDDVISRGMAKKPSERFSSTVELAKAATAAALGAQAPPAPAALPSPPSDTRQFSAVFPNPAGAGYTPYPPEVRPPETPKRKSRFGPTQVALVVATIVLFGVAVVLAAQLISGNRDSGAPPQTTLAVPPPSVSTTTETVEPSTSTHRPHNALDDARRRHRRPARHPCPACRELMRRVSSTIRLDATPGANQPLRSEPPTHWRWCARQRRAVTTTAAND